MSLYACYFAFVLVVDHVVPRDFLAPPSCGLSSCCCADYKVVLQLVFSAAFLHFFGSCEAFALLA
jgi:hypothetical protein